MLHSRCLHTSTGLQYAQTGISRLPQPARRLRLQTCCSIRARWCIDVKYGVKMEAVALLQEWVRDVGGQAGLQSAPENVRIFSGSVGVPESRLELEVDFPTLTELEAFWASIPADQHKAWSQRMQHYILDGSPAWQIFRTVPSFPEEHDAAALTRPAATSAASSAPAATSASQPPEKVEAPKPPASAAEILAQLERGEDVDLGVASGDGVWSPDSQIVLDWKGDPMKINPGDSLPGI